MERESLGLLFWVSNSEHGPTASPRLRTVRRHVDEVASLYEAFHRNILRVQSLGQIPAMIMHNWIAWVGWNKGSLTTRNQNSDIADRMCESIPSIDDLFSRVPNEGTYIAIESLLSSMILGTWTAFETLSGDLWETALNLNPKWAALNCKVKETGHGDSKRVSLNEMNRVTKGSYDLSRKMGTLHRSGSRFKFTALPSIREAYGSAFPHELLNIHEPLDNKSLDALSAVRNLIVHRAGIVDEEYIESAKISPAAPKLELGSHIQLGGELVSNLITPVINNSIKLLKAVDSRIVASRGDK